MYNGDVLGLACYLLPAVHMT